jgi:hypothetical protein
MHINRREFFSAVAAAFTSLAIVAVLAVLSVLPSHAQTQVSIQHACFSGFQFNAAGGVQQMADNLGTLCNSFTIEYSNFGFSALSLLVQSAPDNGGVPGTWVTFAGTVVTGSNPNTGLVTGTTTFTGFYRWVRVTLSSVTGTGTISGAIYGDQVAASPGSSGGGGSACPSPCPVIGPTAVGSPSANPPVQVSENDGNGNLIIPILPTLSTPLTLTTSGLTQIIALSAAKSIRIGHLSLSFASGVDFQLEYGTGSNCAGGTTALTGVYKNILTYAYDDPPGAPLIVPAGNALCANLGTSVTGGGLAQYALF